MGKPSESHQMFVNDAEKLRIKSGKSYLDYSSLLSSVEGVDSEDRKKYVY